MARIVEVATARLVRQLHTPFVTALRRTSEVVSVAVRLTDADGRTGFGEGPQVWRVTGESLAGIEACVLGPLADILLGWDPADEAPSAAASTLGAAVVGNGGAKAACEMAVLDLLAQEAELPLAQLVGATTSSVATDVTLAAQGGFDEGVDASQFGQLKIKVGLDPADVDRVVRIAQEAPGRPVRIDANQAWDLETASRSIGALLAAGVVLEFVEQPLPAWDLAGHAELRRRWGTPIVLDESVFSIHDLRRAIDVQAGDVVNIKLAKCGGIYAGLAIAAEATGAGLGLMVGSMMESELGVSAAAALAAAISPDAVHDLDAAWWSIPLSDAASPYRDGRFVLDPSPGSMHAAGRVVPDSGWYARG
ncbi:MAG: dipeptide epimerase [Actinobacteria bacterium]|nr:dipeptide epimerase [Actinomycetota bacterium]